MAERPETKADSHGNSTILLTIYGKGNTIGKVGRAERALSLFI